MRIRSVLNLAFANSVFRLVVRSSLLARQKAAAPSQPGPKFAPSPPFLNLDRTQYQQQIADSASNAPPRQNRLRIRGYEVQYPSASPRSPSRIHQGPQPQQTSLFFRISTLSPKRK